MTYITDYNASGYTGSFSVTTGGYVFAGAITTDKDNNIKSISCDVSKASNNEKVASLSMYYANTTYSIQDAVAGLVDDVLGALHTDLNS